MRDRYLQIAAIAALMALLPLYLRAAGALGEFGYIVGTLFFALTSLGTLILRETCDHKP